MRGLRNRRPVDWTLAGLTAGLKRTFLLWHAFAAIHFVRLFVMYLFVLHWRQARCYVQHIDGWCSDT